MSTLTPHARRRPSDVLSRMVEGLLPPKYSVEAKPLTDRAALERVYRVVPDMQLNIRFQTDTPEDKARYGLGKGFPIGVSEGKWYFVVCMK